MDADAVREQLGLQAAWQTRRDGRWIEAPDLDVRAMTRLLRSVEARWVTLTVTPSGGGFRLIYHWDLDGQLLNIATRVGEARVDTVADLLPAADWVEREMHDYYALEFSGREDSPALMLRPDDEPGLFSRTQELGREHDPVDDVLAEAEVRSTRASEAEPDAEAVSETGASAAPAPGAGPGAAPAPEAEPAGDGGAS